MNPRAELRQNLVINLVYPTFEVFPILRAARLSDAKVVKLIDVNGFMRIPKKIVQKGSHPCIARLRVGRKPNDATHVGSPKAICGSQV